MERIPPYSIAAEKAVLGACLLNESAVFNAMEIVRSDDFYKKEHQLIYDAIMELSSNSVAIDMVTVMELLDKKGQLMQVGGASYLAELTNEVPSAEAASHYGKIVADRAQIRLLIGAGQQIVDDGFSGQKDALELLGDAEEVLNSVSQQQLRQTFAQADKVMLDEFGKIDSLKTQDGITGIPTFRDVDRYLSGLQKGDMIVLAARPGCGKTSFAMNIAAQAAVKHGKSVAVFSLEMPVAQLCQRMLCSHAKVNQEHWRSGRLSNEEVEKLSEALSDFSGKKLFIDDTAGITIPEIRAKCRRLQQREGIDLIVIDYLQLMRSARRVESRQQEIAEISRSIKQIAKELNVPILALAQLSRQAELGGGKPMLAHLRESGAIEQDADVVLFIHKNQKDNGGSDDEEEDLEANPEGIVELIIAKNRNGPVGEEELAFMKQYTLFGNLQKEFPPRENVF